MPAGWIVTKEGNIEPAEVKDGRIVGWDSRRHAHFTPEQDRAERLAAIRKGVTP